MPLFRRRRDADEADDDALAGDERDLDEPQTPARAVAPGRPAGPWDVEDVTDDLPRLDLGGLQVPVPDGVEVRVDVQDEQVFVTLVERDSALQLLAFAAPRSSGIWSEVREEIAESLRTGGGAAEEVQGPFGPELRATVPGEVPGQGAVLQPARFIGVDGPRWFLRGLLTGAAATDPGRAQRLEDAFRGVVVVRGGEAMAPRDMLPLRLPREAMQAMEEQAAAAGTPPTFEMPERGPEITETR